MRVLVVEDEERLASGLRAGLEAEGFAVDVAANGPDGLWRARESRYDAIVLDLMLPGMSGFKVCSLLHKPAREKVKIHIDYLGFTIPDQFVVGYGLDVDERFRNLPFIGVMRAEAATAMKAEAATAGQGTTT